MRDQSTASRWRAAAAGETADNWPVRGRRRYVERKRDDRWQAWIARFDFVSARELAVRFGVSEQKARRAAIERAPLL